MAPTYCPRMQTSKETVLSKRPHVSNQDEGDDTQVHEAQQDEGSFRFINVDKYLKINQKGREVIRTQVMTDFYRKARQSSSYGHDVLKGSSGKVSGGFRR
jgi:hypothetical protein